MTRRKTPKNGTRISVPADVQARQTKSLSLEVAAKASKPCSTNDPELFFPIGQGAPAREQAAEAKALCRQCDVRNQCLEVTLRGEVEEPNFADGVFGGFTPQERAFEVEIRRWEARKAKEAAARAAVEANAGQDDNTPMLLPIPAEEVAA